MSRILGTYQHRTACFCMFRILSFSEKLDIIFARYALPLLHFRLRTAARINTADHIFRSSEYAMGTVRTKDNASAMA